MERMRSPLIENPPWVTRVIAKNFDRLSESVRPEWMPVFEEARATRRGELVVEIPEFGCGAYGCVMPTNDENVVFKITTDSTEFEFIEKILPKVTPRPDGFVEYYSAIPLIGKEGRGKHKPKNNNVYAIWREEAEDVGEMELVTSIPRQDRARALDLIHAQHAAATEAFVLLRKHPDEYPAALAARDKALARLRELHLDEISNDPVWEDLREVTPISDAIALLLGYVERMWEHLAREGAATEIGHALLACLRRGILVSDVHGGNIGRVKRGGAPFWVITDPGNVAVLPSPWGESPTIRNPAGSFEADFDAAFLLLNQQAGGHNYVLIYDLRQALPQYSRAEFDAGLNDLRRARKYSADTAEGRHVRYTREQIEGGLRQGGENLMYLAKFDRNPPWDAGEKNVPIDMTLISEMEADPARYRRGAQKVIDAAAQAVASGQGFGPKAFICDVAEGMGTKTHRIAHLLVAYNMLGWIQLSRADLVGAMDPKKVAASHIHSAGADFHFVTPPSPRRR
jgi:hypothetical protein